MNNSQNDLVLALLATLEARAKKTGKKSVVKGVVSYLVQGGAAESLINQVRALGANAPPTIAAPTKNGARPSSKAKGKSAKARQTSPAA